MCDKSTISLLEKKVCRLQVRNRNLKKKTEKKYSHLFICKKIQESVLKFMEKSGKERCTKDISLYEYWSFIAQCIEEEEIIE